MGFDSIVTSVGLLNTIWVACSLNEFLARYSEQTVGGAFTDLICPEC